MADMRATVRATLGPALIAAALAVVTTLALRYIFAVPMPAELFSDQATSRIPLPVFETLLATFGSAAKHLYLIGGLVAEAGLTALAGILYLVVREQIARTRLTLPHALTYADIPLIMLALWLLSAGVLAPIIGGGFLGMGLLGGVRLTLLSQLAPDAVFAGIFYWQLREEAGGLPAYTGSDEHAGELSRRALLRQSAVAAATLGGGIVLWQALTSGLGALIGTGPAAGSGPTLSLSDSPSRITPPPKPVYTALKPVVGQSPEVTAANQFYVVSKNLAGDPNLDATGWKLSFTGLVEKPYTLTYDQLLALPQITQYHTLECISNEVGGDLMSNGYFTGISLADALNTAGVRIGATEMIFTAADGYSDSLHLSQALDERSMIAYLLDGQPLPKSHGYPARLLIPGLYGMKNGKWLTQLSLATGPYQGYWEQRGWNQEAFVKLTSRIDTPHDGDLLVARRTPIAGVAYSGAKGIARVDVSLDAGQSWQPAQLKQPVGALSWTLWQYAWTPSPGVYTLVVRAIDLEGNVQTPKSAPTLPDGASGYHAIAVTVR